MVQRKGKRKPRLTLEKLREQAGEWCFAEATKLSNISKPKGYLPQHSRDRGNSMAVKIAGSRKKIRGLGGWDPVRERLLNGVPLSGWERRSILGEIGRRQRWRQCAPKDLASDRNLQVALASLKMQMPSWLGNREMMAHGECFVLTPEERRIHAVTRECNGVIGARFHAKMKGLQDVPGIDELIERAEDDNLDVCDDCDDCDLFAGLSVADYSTDRKFCMQKVD